MNNRSGKTLAAVGLLVFAGCATSGHVATSTTQQMGFDAVPVDRSAAQFENWSAQHLAWADVYRHRILEAPSPRTVGNTLVPYNRMLMYLEEVASQSTLFAMVHPDQRVRTVARQAEADVAAYLTDVSLDHAIFDAMQAIDLRQAGDATRHAVRKILRDYRRAGVNLDEETRSRIAACKAEIVDLGRQFLSAQGEDVREILVDPHQLAGLPADWIKKHAPDEGGKVHVTTDYPDLHPFLMYAEDADARRQLYLAFRSRAYPQNQDVLMALITKRHELATMLGYDHWADYATEDKMIGSAVAAQSFVDQIAELSRPAVDRDLAVLLKRKRRDHPRADAVEEFERYYYLAQVRNERFGYDPQEVRAYFDFRNVLSGLFRLTQDTFAIEYRRVRGVKVWHPSVTVWDVYDTDRLIGRFYLDLHPRPDKYGHGACFGYSEGIAGYRLPQAALVCNFPNPADADNGVALMEHKDVVALFHEFGHLLHALFAGQRQWMVNAGLSTERDFVEVPSSILEEWCYTQEALELFARHYMTDRPMPVELIESLRQASSLGAALETGQQLFYAALSLNCYNRDPAEVDLDALAVDLQGRYSPYPHMDGTHLACSFGHLYGYSALYYTYTWSKVIAKDMFTRFVKEGVFNPATARAYRDTVLAPGSSKDAADMIQNFLGRPHNAEAFKAWLDRG